VYKANCNVKLQYQKILQLYSTISVIFKFKILEIFILATLRKKYYFLINLKWVLEFYIVIDKVKNHTFFKLYFVYFIKINALNKIWCGCCLHRNRFWDIKTTCFSSGVMNPIPPYFCKLFVRIVVNDDQIDLWLIDTTRDL